MTRQIGYLPVLWDSNRIMAATWVALLPPVFMAAVERGQNIVAPLVLALGLAVLWPLLFAHMRRRAMDWNGITTALIFVVLLAGPVPLWQQGLALSFGLVMGDLIFGGRGRGFLSPAVVGLAFLLFSFPGTASGAQGQSIVIAAGVGGAILVMAGLLSWRIVLGFTVAIGALAAFSSPEKAWETLQSANLVLGLVFLVGDPVAAACTNAGRWAYGGLAGALLVLLGEIAGVGALATIVFAALLASIFAPLIDQIVIAANVRRRARRQVDG